MSLEDRLFKELNERREQSNLRNLSTTSGLIDFVSNDYLGLSRSEILRNRISKELEKVEVNGSTGSRLLSGNSELCMQVEAQLAKILQVESALLFDSGYMANLAVLSTIPKRGDTIIYDELSHACIKDGARLSLAQRFSFRHNDLNDLEKKVKTAKGQAFIVVESVYSMDGDLCPIEELINLSKVYDAKIIIDEAHGTGVYGKKGNGLSGQFNDNDIFCKVYTFGKAMGIHGAAVAGNRNLTDYLINFARPFIYTTAPSPYSIIAAQEAFRFLTENIDLQKKVLRRVEFFISEFEKSLSSQIQRTNSFHPIQGLIIPGNKKVKQIASQLSKNGFDVRPILSPTVKEGQERLRVCLHTYNSDEEISSLVREMKKLL